MFRVTSLHDSLEDLDRAFAARTHDTAEVQPSGWLLIDPAGGSAGRLLDALEERIGRAGGVVVAGSWREGLLRPYGGLLDLVDDLLERVSENRPELLSRYSLTLANLLPAWRRAEPLRRVRELRSGLADFMLDGDRLGLKDFYWKRNVRPLIVADLVHFILDAAAALADETGAATVLRLEGLHLADPPTLEAVRLLGRYGAKLPVMLCAAARRPPGGEADFPEPREWSVLRLEEEPGGLEESEAGALAPEDLDLVEAASVFALPFRLSSWLSLLPEERRETAAAALEPLVKERVFRRLGEDRFAVSAWLREEVYGGLDPERRRDFHRAGLDAEAVDPFAATWHAFGAGCPDGIARLSLVALRRAWAVSDYDCALALARHHLAAANGQGRLDGDLLLALLAYEAGGYSETEEHLQRALARQTLEGIDRTTLLRLLGYNAIFGLGELDRGREILQEVLASYEAEGRERDAGFVRNSIAFSFVRAGRVDDAIETENVALELLKSSDQPGGFLFSVLQLNLGRLYRQLGLSDQALDLFRRSMESEGAEFSPYMLLIFHASLAQLHEGRGAFPEALASYHHCLELSRDLELENASYPVLNLLSRPVGPLLSGLMTRGDEIFFYLYLNLALTCRRLGLHRRAAAYLAGLRSNWSFLGEEVWQAVDAALATAAPAPAQKGSDAAGFAREVEGAMARFAELLREAAGGQDLLKAVAGTLAEGRVVALVRPREVGPGIWLTDSLVLYDPRRPDLAQRVNAEFGAYASPAGRTVLALPEAADLFHCRLEPLPLVFQERSVRPEQRGELPALASIRLRVQVLSPELDGDLFGILQMFRELTGVGVLASVPFHPRGAGLATAPEKALQTFLVSSLDGLVLGDRLLDKTHGAAAEENLLPFRPRLSQRVSIIHEGDGSILLLMRVWFYQSCLRLNGGVRPILDLCDGRSSVEDVVRSLAGRFPENPHWERNVCGFLRDLGRHGVMWFDEPALAPARPLEVGA